MSDAELVGLAEAAGVAPRWKDAFGAVQEVTPDTLRAVLRALDVPADTEAEIRDSRARLAEQAAATSELPPLITALSGQELRLPVKVGRFRVTLEDGTSFEGEARHEGEWSILPTIDIPGYHELALADTTITLAVAPGRCLRPHEITGQARSWGLAVQLYALRRAGDGGIGDFAALRDFVGAAARHGAQAVAISPVHAQFSADPDRFSPYAPSSRVMLNVLHAALPEDTSDTQRAQLEALALVDWPAGSRHRLAALRRLYDQGRDRAALDRFRAEQGEGLERHARFEALHAHLFGEDPGRWNWRDWPDAYREPANRAVGAFAEAHAGEVGFHAWLQFRADQGLAEAQHAARAAGMKIGLISDLAVGTDAGGSHAWSRQDETLIGLTVGAPPDLLAPAGQNWGLVAFSSRGLRRHGYGAFLEMIRAALRHAGGVRIDHVMGLNRLWVIPEGGAAGDGAYLGFPEHDLLRLVALESHRHRAIMLGEDLGTVPEGFSDRLRDAGVMGLRVLWFERDQQQRFKPPTTWTPEATAMTSTHDLATIAGWWEGRDLDLRAGIGHMRDEGAERAGREADRGAIWQAFRDSGAAAGEPPASADPARAVDAAVAHVGVSACELMLLPVEDALGLPEQPNLPGTIDEHPNWRRRLSAPAAGVLDDPACAARLAALSGQRT